MSITSDDSLFASAVLVYLCSHSHFQSRTPTSALCCTTMTLFTESFSASGSSKTKYQNIKIKMAEVQQNSGLINIDSLGANDCLTL